MGLQGLRQRATEDMTEFLQRVTQDFEDEVAHESAGEALIHDLAWQGLNGEHHAALAPVRSKPLDDWLLSCQDIRTHSAQTERLPKALSANHTQRPTGSAEPHLC